jgi:cholesterol transport system auxiliary component
VKARVCGGVLASSMGLFLSGCAGLLHSDARPEESYYLRARAAAVTDATQKAAVSLRVGHPVAAPGLDSPHIMLVQADHRMNFYTGSRWVAPATEVVESLAVQTLRESGAWTSVEDSGSPFPSDYLLAIDLRRFEADYTAGGALPVVHVVLECIVGRREGRDVVATFVAAGDAPAAANRMSGVVAAFEQASTAAMDVLAQQALQAVRADLQRAAQNPASPAPSSKR